MSLLLPGYWPVARVYARSSTAHSLDPARKPLGLPDAVFAALPGGQQAIRNVAWFRATLDLTSVLLYFDHPRLRVHADRLVADVAYVGAHPFTPVVAELVSVGQTLEVEPAWDGTLLGIIDELEAELLGLERRHRSLWWHLTSFGDASPPVSRT